VDPFERRAIGRTDLRVTALGCGSATLGDGRAVIPEAQSDAARDEALYRVGMEFETWDVARLKEIMRYLRRR